jgi:hypothetical protein
MATGERRTSSRIANKPASEEKSSSSSASTASKRKTEPVPSKTAKKAKAEEKPDNYEIVYRVVKIPETPANGGSSSSKTLSVGSPLPAITLKNESGKDVEIATLKKTVIFT